MLRDAAAEDGSMIQRKPISKKKAPKKPANTLKKFFIFTP
jgi:hypothetical protein